MPFPSLVLIAWIPACAMFFVLFRPVRALTLAYLFGWLLLPPSAVAIQGFWDIDKTVATNAGVLMGMALFCPGQFRGYKVTMADVVLVFFAVGTCVTSLTNSLGLYNGISSITHQLLRYGVPFILGRAIIRTRGDLHDASRIIVCGAALYALLAVWEWRMSPQLRLTVYGLHSYQGSTLIRWGFYRPILFSSMSLAVSTFFMWTALLGVWLWRCGRLPAVLGVPPVVIAMLPLVGLLVSMSLGPYMLFAIGLGLLVLGRRRGRAGLLWVPIAFSLLWMVGRYSGLDDGRWLPSAVRRFAPERAGSLEYRINAESHLLARAKARPLFGWGAWGRNRVVDETGRDLVATDGLWIIFLGTYGLFGLTSFYLWWCWPVLMIQRASQQTVLDPAVMALLVAIGLQAANFLFNGFLSPVLIVMCGAVVTAVDRPSREWFEVPRKIGFTRPTLAHVGKAST